MSLKPNPVNWFEIPVSDMNRAIKFYNQVFDLALTAAEFGPRTFAFFPVQPHTPGAGGSLASGLPIKPSLDGTTVYLNVESIDPMLEKIHKAGGKTLLPRAAIGQHGFIAHFEDSEGNRVALHEQAKM